MNLFDTASYAKTIRILVYPNITYAKDLTKDSYIAYLALMMRALTAVNPNLFFYVLTPKTLPMFDAPNVEQILYAIPTHAPVMRVHFDVPQFTAIASKFIDIDLVWSHLPEHTHAIVATLENVTHHRPKVFGYAHWFDFINVATWGGSSFRENISGLLHMDRCYLNTAAQKAHVLADATQTFSSSVVAQLDNTLVVQYPPIDDDAICVAPRTETEKIIVFNHRPETYKDFPQFLATVRALREQRQDFTVWVPLLDGTPSEPWITNEKFDKAGYYQRLSQCRVGYAPKQAYDGWSISTTDGLMNGCPYIMYAAPYYTELHAGAETFTTLASAVDLLNRYLDDDRHRTHAAEAGIIRAHELRASLVATTMNDYIVQLAESIPVRDTPKSQELIDIIKAHGSITKRELVTQHLNWGRGIPFTPYRRAFLSHPHIFDTIGSEPTYQWKE